MKLFLDVEFNGERGELISLALVPEDGEHTFYEVLRIDEPFWLATTATPFVKEHVLPVLGQLPIPWNLYLTRLDNYLAYFRDVHVIADWPADFEHLCAALSAIGAAGGYTSCVELTMQLVNTPKLNSAIPHNALEDAKALRDWWVTSHAQVTHD